MVALVSAGDRPGRPSRAGREVFSKTCATCHQAEGRGVDVGPNLATVTNRSPEDLLVHILDPNREVAPNFVNYNVATGSGRVPFWNHRRGIGRRTACSGEPRPPAT